MIIKAKYFDGKTSKPQLVDLEVSSDNQVAFYHESRRQIWTFDHLNIEKNGSDLLLTKKNNLSESLKIENPEIAKRIYRFAKNNNKISWYQTIIDWGPKFYITATAVIIVFIASFYIFIIPWIGEKTVEIVPTSFDDHLGKISYEHIKTISKIDENKSAILQDFANQINFDTDRNLSFKVIESKEVNAFALPDGTVAVYTGLLSKINNYEELAALLGHEVTHVKERHSTKTLARSLAGYIVISLVIGDASGITTSLANNANELNNLSFSRDFEKSSDLGGYEILKKNKIDPKGMHQLFLTLKSSHDAEIPAILSSHPLTDERINYSKELINKKEYSFSKQSKLEQIFKKLKE